MLGQLTDDDLGYHIRHDGTVDHATSTSALPVISAVLLQRRSAQMRLLGDHGVLRRHRRRHFIGEPHS